MPLLQALQIGGGLLQAGLGAINSRAATRQLERLQSPKYSQNQSIMDFYNQALQRYNVSPTDSAMYKRQNRDIDRGVAGSIAALQDRRSGTAGASSILRAANDARLDANVAAEQEKSQRFGQLGSATQLKANEDDKAFQYNEQLPYERKYNLLAMKAGGANQTTNAGLSNVFGGLQNWGNMNMLKQFYGEGGDGAGRNAIATGSNPLVGLNNDFLFKNRNRRYNAYPK